MSDLNLGFMDEVVFDLNDYAEQAIEVKLIDVRRVQPKDRDLIWFHLDFEGHLIERCVKSVEAGEIKIDFTDRYVSLFKKLTLASSPSVATQKMIELGIPFEIWINANGQPSNPQASKSDYAKEVYLKVAKDNA